MGPIFPLADDGEYVCLSLMPLLRRYVPVAAYAVAWLKTRFHFGNALKAVAGRIAAAAQPTALRVAAWLHGVQLFFCRTQPTSDGVELKPQRRVKSDELKRSLIS